MNNLKLRMAGYQKPTLATERFPEIILYNYEFSNRENIGASLLNKTLFNKLNNYYKNEKNIFQIHHDKKLIPKFISDKIKNLNKDYNYYLLDFEECKEIIEKEIYDTDFKNEIVYAFKNIKDFKYKSYLLRYSLLYIFGGCYLDTKLEALNLNNYQNIDFLASLKKEEINIDFMICKKESPLLLELIKFIINNLDLEEHTHYLFNFLKNNCRTDFNFNKLLKIDNNLVYFLENKCLCIDSNETQCLMDNNNIITKFNQEYTFE